VRTSNQRLWQSELHPQSTLAFRHLALVSFMIESCQMQNAV
jgi:hypothetical protein